MEILAPLLSRGGWVAMALGVAVQAFWPKLAVAMGLAHAHVGPFGAIDLASVAAVVAIVCPLGGLACVVVNTVIGVRNSEAQRARLRRESFERGRADGIEAGRALSYRKLRRGPDGKWTPEG